MAGIGSAWGTREEMLHPRDRHGRFRKKWKMAAGVVDALSGFLDRFQPRQFQSDQQAAQYSFNHRKQPWTTPEMQRLHTDWDDANESLQAGEMDETTQKFVTMMDRAMVPTTDDLIVSQTLPTTAFGLSPQQAALEDGGLEDLIGLEIADAGYAAWNLGSELSHPPGSVTIRMAMPKGTKVAMGGRSPNDRGLFTDRDQPLVITKVEPDGRGGWYMLAIAGSGARTKGATQVADDRTHGRRGGGLTPEQREARVTPQMSGEERLRIAQQNEREMQQGVVPATSPGAPAAAPAEPAATPAPAPAAPASPPAPTPAGVVERREPVQSEAVGPGSPEGKSPSDIATDAEAARVQAENAPPAPPAATPESFRAAVATTDLKAPSRGKRQKEFNDAIGGIASGKTSPQDALRQLDTDIEVNKRALQRQKDGTEKPDPELEQDIKDQEALADLISSHHGVQRRGAADTTAPAAPEAPAAAPVKKAAKAAPTKAPAKKAGPAATPGAPSTAKEGTPKAPEPAPDKRTKAELLKEAGPAGRARMTKDQLRKAIADRDAAPAGAPTPAPAKKAAGAPAMTPDNERRLINAAERFRANPRNEEEERIVRQADEILARRAGTPVKKTAAKKAAPETPVTPAKKVAKKTNPNLAGLSDEDLTKITESDQFRDDQKEAIRQEQAARVAKKAAPAKAVPKKATPAKAAPSPVDAEEEAFKARVAEAGLPDKVADLRTQAREKKIRGFSTMNKRQLQSALLGDEVPRASKIAPVTPAKLVPHLEAADSDQAARTLLEGHTLPDLKELAKSRGLEIPKRGATKDKLKDDILADVRGVPEGAGGETPARSLRQELDAQKWVQPEDGVASRAVDDILSDTNEGDAAELRDGRDKLENLSKDLRTQGKRQDANLVQTLADTMGMRAQVISGVEEGPSRAPAKRAAKKAVAAVPEGEAPERPLNKMLKPELMEVARGEGLTPRASWTKAKLLDEIEKNRRVQAGRGDESDEDRTRQAFQEAATAVETPAPVKKATKKAAKKAVADVDRAAGGLAAEVRRTPAGTGQTFGDILRQTDAEELRQEVKRSGLGDIEGNTAEEIFDNTIKKALEDRMRELGMLPEDPAKPTRAQKRVPKGSVPGRAITTPDRKQSFREAWDGQKFVATGAAARSMDEVRDDIESGKITPEEGVRRLDNDIAFNEDEVNDIQAELEGMDPDDREASDLNLRGAQLEESVRAQKKAKAFIRAHFKDEAPVTRQELEIQLDGPELAALQRADIDELKKAAKDEGLGNIQGDDKDTVVQNIGRAVAAREIANREREQRDRDQQARKDTIRQTAEAIAGIGQAMEDGGSDRAVASRIRAHAKTSKLSPELRQEMLDAVGDRDRLRAILDRTAGENGLRRLDTPGQKTHFDPERHEGEGFTPREPVTVLEPGFRADVGGEDIPVLRAKVMKGHVDEPTPTGVSTPDQPPVQAAPGTAAGRITTSRLTPGTRIMVMPKGDGTAQPTTRKTGAIPVTITKIEGARVGGRRRGEYKVTATDGDGNELDLGVRPGAQTHMLEPPPKAPKATKKAVQAARDDEAASGTPEEIGARLSDIENPPSQEEAMALLAPLNKTQLRKMARDRVIPGAGNMNEDQLRDEIYISTAGRLSAAKATRGFGGRTPADVPVRTGDITPIVPVKKVAKAAVPAKAAPKPVVDLDNPTRHDAEVIGTGLDLDPKGEDKLWLAAVQSELDAGVDGRQIANSLRRDADASRAGAVLRLGDWVDDREPGPPEVEAGRARRRAERQAERDKLNARVDRMELMADRLEGVRPIKKAAPAAPAKAAPEAGAPTRRDMDTMQAAQAQSKALSDLRSGKSHAEVARELRAKATGVGSREHDPQTVRPLEFTPSERSAMKRNDAKKLRELAAEVQAQGVAQRAEARAAKKTAAPAKKALPPTGRKAVPAAGVFSDDPAVRKAASDEIERFNEEVAAGRAAAKAAAPKKRTAAELRRARNAAEGEGVPVEQVLERWDQQKLDRKNLTGPVGEMIAAQIEDAHQALLAADTPARESEATGRLLHPELRTWAEKLGLSPSGTKAVLEKRIADRIKGREAPGASAERAVPSAPAAASGVDESVPMQPYSKSDNMRMHIDSPTMGLVKAYERAGRNGSANRVLDLRRRATEKGGSTTPQQVVDELKAIRAQETDPGMQRELDRAIAANDAPMTPIPDLPPGTPSAARELMERLHAIPYARKGPGADAAIGVTSKDSLVDQLADVYRQLASGELRTQPDMKLRQILTQQVHEMNEPSFRIWELAGLLEPVTDAQGRRRPSPLTTALREMRGGGEGKAPAPSEGRPSYDERLRAVAEIASSPGLTSRALRQGASAKVSAETAPDGRQIVTKVFSGSEGKTLADKEELGPRVVDALGVRAPAIVRTGDRSVVEEFMEGTFGDDIVPWGGSVPQEILDSDDGRLIGLADYLTQSTDRNPGNWLRLPDGRLGTVDHADMFMDDQDEFVNPKVPYGLWADFSGYLRGPDDANEEPTLPDQVDLHPADLAIVRQRITALRPQFTARDRLFWYNQMLLMLKELESRATGTRRLIKE